MKKTAKGMVKNAVPSAKTGAPVQNGNKRAAALDSKGVSSGQTKKGMVRNGVAAGKGSADGQRKPAENGSTKTQQVSKTNGGIGSPNKMLGLDDGALRNVSNHGHGNAGKGGQNRFDLYNAARK